MQLHNPDLLRQQAFIDGAWVAGAATFAVTDPASGAVLAHVPAPRGASPGGGGLARPAGQAAIGDAARVVRSDPGQHR